MHSWTKSLQRHTAGQKVSSAKASSMGEQPNSTIPEMSSKSKYSSLRPSSSAKVSVSLTRTAAQYRHVKQPELLRVIYSNIQLLAAAFFQHNAYCFLAAPYIAWGYGLHQPCTWESMWGTFDKTMWARTAQSDTNRSAIATAAAEAKHLTSVSHQLSHLDSLEGQPRWCLPAMQKHSKLYKDSAEGILVACPSVAMRLLLLTPLWSCPELTVFTQTFFLIFPLIWHSLFVPSIHIASSLPLPSMRKTCAYSVSRALSLVQQAHCTDPVSLHTHLDRLLWIWARASLHFRSSLWSYNLSLIHI